VEEQASRQSIRIEKGVTIVSTFLRALQSEPNNDDDPFKRLDAAFKRYDEVSAQLDKTLAEHEKDFERHTNDPDWNSIRLTMSGKRKLAESLGIDLVNHDTDFTGEFVPDEESDNDD
jgi:hypothetical protein